MEDEALNQLLAGGAGVGVLWTLGKLFFQRAFTSIQEIRGTLQQTLIEVAEIRTELKLVPRLSDNQERLEQDVHNIEKDVSNLKVRFEHFEKRRNVKSLAK